MSDLGEQFIAGLAAALIARPEWDEAQTILDYANSSGMCRAVWYAWNTTGQRKAVREAKRRARQERDKVLHPYDLDVLKTVERHGPALARDFPRSGLDYGDRLPKLVRRGLVAKKRQSSYHYWEYELTDAGRAVLKEEAETEA